MADRYRNPAEACWLPRTRRCAKRLPVDSDARSAGRRHHCARHGHVRTLRAVHPDAPARRGRQDRVAKFHVVKHLPDAVDKVRREEHRALRRGGDERLTGSKYLWLRRPEDMTDDQRAAFPAAFRADKGREGTE